MRNTRQQQLIDRHTFILIFSAKSTAFLYTVMTLCTVFEIISFFAASLAGTSTAPSPLAFFDILIALQGVVIFIIFVCLPVPKQIIQRWWISRGSLDLHMAEMEALNWQFQYKMKSKYQNFSGLAYHEKNYFIFFFFNCYIMSQYPIYRIYIYIHFSMSFHVVGFCLLLLSHFFFR